MAPKKTELSRRIGAAWRVFFGGASRCLSSGRDQVALFVIQEQKLSGHGTNTSPMELTYLSATIAAHCPVFLKALKPHTTLSSQLSSPTPNSPNRPNSNSWSDLRCYLNCRITRRPNRNRPWQDCGIHHLRSWRPPPYRPRADQGWASLAASCTSCVAFHEDPAPSNESPAGAWFLQR